MFATSISISTPVRNDAHLLTQLPTRHPIALTALTHPLVLPHTGAEPGEFKSSVLSLLRRLLPEWTHVQDVSIEPITGGITNELTLATPTSNPPGSAHQETHDLPSPVVVRVFGNGTDAFLDRGAENRAVRALNAHGFGATCLGLSPTGGSRRRSLIFDR